MGGEKGSKPSVTDYPTLVERPVGKQIRGIYKSRLDQFRDGGQYSGNNLMASLYEGRADDEDHVSLQVWDAPDLERPSFKDMKKNAKFHATKKGKSFGPSWSTHWFKIHLTVPKDLEKKDHLEFHWDTGSEGMVWTEDGEPLQGLTGGERTEWIFPKSWRDGAKHTFYIEMACNGMFGNASGDIIQPPDMNKYFTLRTADIVAVDLEARGLYVDFWILKDAAREFPQDQWESHHAQQICNRIMDTFYMGEGSHETILECRKIAREYLGDVDSAKVYDTDKEDVVYGIGHCHIDTCWLWPWDETKRKVARSWASQCDLIERYPEHRFTASSAQQYEWLEQLYPKLFDRVKKHVKEGTFLPIGGSWVEHDTNMPSGEGLVRQFILGQRFFESHFGERCRTFWLPDTFGYSAQLPQLCRLAGMHNFFTQKLSWNNVNKFPHTTFNWVALDGSQVICHMTPAETYTANADFGDLTRSYSQHKSLDQDNTSLLVFGRGDGGGGPLREHIEKLRRCRGIADKTGILPRIKMGYTVDDFYSQLEKKLENGTELVTWYGELYFEFHRGTYTTQANNKRNNRKSEIMMRDAELLATLATLKDSSYKYPKADVDEAWKLICLCHFHDCLPGTCIEMCYDDSDEAYAKCFKLGHKVISGAMNALGLSDYDAKTQGSNPLVLNLLPWDRNEYVKMPGNKSEYQIARTRPGLGQTKPSPRSAYIKESDGSYILGNEHLEIRIEDGNIVSMHDKRADRELIREGEKANQYVLFDDKPLYWQAWDVEVYHFASRQELKTRVTGIVDKGPERVSVMTETKISGESWVKTEIALSASGDDIPAMITMDSHVHWNEDKKFLKVEFPVDIVNTEATYETQYGLVRRPTHYNTSWDMAKFEVCCHKWADLSEHGYGVSILNDSKYGFATAGNVMRLSLLRAPKAPDAHADMGKHRIRYAIFPHQGGLDARTVRAGYNFNHDMRLVTAQDAVGASALLAALRLDSAADAIILDHVKRGEDDEDVSLGELPKRKGRSIVLRLFESMGGQARGKLHWDTSLVKVKKVFKTNVLEDDLEEIHHEKDHANIQLRPFEVATYRLQL